LLLCLWQIWYENGQGAGADKIVGAGSLGRVAKSGLSF